MNSYLLQEVHLRAPECLQVNILPLLLLKGKKKADVKLHIKTFSLKLLFTMPASLIK